MSTPRPTPETDAAEINLGSSCGQFSKWYVKPGFARKLERQRDEAREQLEAMREAIKEAAPLVECLRGGHRHPQAEAALAKLQPHLYP